MSLADELFSCLDSNKPEGRQKSDNRTGRGGDSTQAGRSSQERGRREQWHRGNEYGDSRGTGRYNRNDYGNEKYDGEGRSSGGGGTAAVGNETAGGRGYDRRSGSVSTRKEPTQHVKRDRSEDVRSKSDLYAGRNFDERGKQAGHKSYKNVADEHSRTNYMPEERPGHKRNISGLDSSKHRLDHNSKKPGNESSSDSLQKHSHSQIDKNPIESNSAQESRKPGKKFSKSDDYSDNVPFKLINYKKLEELANGSPTELLVALANRHSGFENRLRETLSPDYIMLIMKSLAKLCKADFHENKVGILSHACEPEFLNQVSDYLKKLPFEGDENRRSRMDEFLANILTFSRTTLDLLPDKACDKLPEFLETTDRAMRCIEACQAIKFPNALNEGFVDLDCRLKVRISEREKRHQKQSASNNAVVEDSPPDNFREINIFPTARDILSSEAAFIRPNIVKGAYSSVEHYLDIQFRLLREDFVCPLREGITDYMSNTAANGTRKKRINNVRIYRKVHFVAPRVVKDVVGLDVCFDSSNHSSKVKWEHNKRFMFGSLLCFSKDNFASIFFGTVIERDLKSLKKGIITVELRNVEHITNSMFQLDFIMAESEVYFEPYFHVLNALQKLQPDSFPMRQYIVDVDTVSAAPTYIQTQPDFKYNIKGYDVSVLDDLTWPTAEQLQLDNSQYIAFKSALTKEFVVIQGPPGTGKTYIGLKIVAVLLRNSPIWNESKRPILVVCYTNHALDQFLEGILRHTKNIVRVGGQSKCESLAEFNLKELRRKNVRNADTSMLMRDIHSSMSSMMSDIKLIQVDLESINSGAGVISLRVLRAGDIASHHLSNFFGSDGKIDDEIFVEWLEIGMQYSEDFQLPDAREEVGQAMETQENEDANLEGDPNDGLWQNAFDDSIDFVLNPMNITTHVKFALTLNAIRQDISGLYEKRAQMDGDRNPALRKQCFQLDREIKEYHNCLNYWHNCVRNVGRSDDETAQRLLLSENLWQLSPNERWIIYSFWVNNFKRRMLSDLRVLECQLRTQAKRYEEVRQIGDGEVMKNALVVGMTTSGAARLQPLLQALKPRIVIVEEAAEVMESHIVVSLTNRCQHLILIGDHKQLRPSTAVYKLAREYKFDISLFERMITNGMHCETLKVQHRMRPEIARLIVPAIYPELHNHPSVNKYKPVEGTTKSLYFLSHDKPEDEVEDSQSRKNVHEAKFLVALARHLVLQGYQPENITMLTTYKGQMFYLRSEARVYQSLEGMKITVVDNYQGEENDIVLLSLVRSNKDAVIGFLKTENRVCVALSRAKMGLFIIGNLENLTRSSSIWPKVKASLESQECVGDHLTLRCQQHTAQFTKVACAEDFHSAPEGGCSQPCDTAMPCGHTCRSVCHVLNRDHIDYKCLEPCRRVPTNCPVEHACLKACWEQCGKCTAMVEQSLPCGHVMELPCHMDPAEYRCPRKVTVTLPDCEHEVEKPCSVDVKDFRCNQPCEDRLPCGHSCEGRCHVRSDPDHNKFQCNKPCARKNAGCSMNHPCKKRCYEECGLCMMEVKKKLPHCDHEHVMHCGKDPASVVCKRKCRNTLECGHPCPRKCFEKCGGCPVKVKKEILSCGHIVELECWQPAVPDVCRERCNKLLPCGHGCKELCSYPCTKRCMEPLLSRVRPACNHAVQVPCYESNSDLDPYSDYLLSRCSMPCGSLLECMHRCPGTCGECLQGRVHVACLQKCDKALICGHRCHVPCSVSCPPCNRKCNMFRCRHSRCNNKCGEPCTPCNEQCGWKCEHMRCTKKCHEMCDREPCTEPCKCILRCGHPCIGFCGEPCPPLCRVCDAEQVTTIFFGTEDEEGARFVYLEDCRHVLESDGLQHWMQQSDFEIRMKGCPICTTPIIKTQRFMNIVKKVYEDISKVKHKVYGDLKAFKIRSDELSKQLKATVNPFGLVLEKEHLKVYIKVYNQLDNELHGVRRKRRGTCSGADMSVLQIKVQILDELAKTANLVSKSLDQSSKEKLSGFLHVLLRVLESRGRKISDQEVEDIKLELRRFYRVSQLLVLESEPSFRSSTTNEVCMSHREALALARSIDKYDDSQDALLKRALEKLKEALKSSVVLSDKERKEIVKAMGLKQGHWYKCPNGHPYVITECGGAMQVGRCSDCGADIGGTRHRLLSSNAVATEMDGATRPAYP